MDRRKAAKIVDLIAADISERCGLDLAWLELGYGDYYELRSCWTEILVRGSLPPKPVPNDGLPRKDGCPVH